MSGYRERILDECCPGKVFCKFALAGNLLTPIYQNGKFSAESKMRKLINCANDQRSEGGHGASSERTESSAPLSPHSSAKGAPRARSDAHGDLADAVRPLVAYEQPRCHRCGGKLPLEGEDYDQRVTDYCCTECAVKVIGRV